MHCDVLYPQARLVILDENDNAPMFSRSEYVVSVLQDAPEGTQMVSVRATDMDQGSNGRVRYSIIDDPSEGASVRQANTKGEIIDFVNPTNCNGKHWHLLFALLGLFGVDPNSGAVFTRRSLASVADIVYRLTLQAEDGGYPARSGRATLSVFVENSQGYSGKPRFLFPPQDGENVQIPEVSVRRGFSWFELSAVSFWMNESSVIME